jgi:hypothetical protein
MQECLTSLKQIREVKLDYQWLDREATLERKMNFEVNVAYKKTDVTNCL